MVDGLVDIKGKITARIEAVKMLDRNRTAWVSILEDFSARMPEFLWMTALRETQPMGAATARAPGDTAAAAAHQGPIQTVPAEMEGYAYSLSGLANLIINMRKSGHFENVDLMHAREVELESHKAYSFAISCTLNYSGGPDMTPGVDTDRDATLAQATSAMGKRN